MQRSCGGNMLDIRIGQQKAHVAEAEQERECLGDDVSDV